MEENKTPKDFLKDLFSDRIWAINMDNLSTARKRVARFIKLMRIVFEHFARNRIGFQCVALSYFCTIALVPMTALIFAITGGLGLENKIAQLLHSIIPGNPEFVSSITEKAGNIIDVAQSGTAGAISAFFFIWAVIWMMFQIERVFNNVWGIRKIPRKVYKRFSVYILSMLVIPFVLVLFSVGIAMYTNLFNVLNFKYLDAHMVQQLLSWLVSYAIIVLAMTIMFKYIPAAKVEMRCAFKSALVTGVIFALFQYIYLQTQLFVTRLNAVYGAIAAIPLFLMWLNYSWQIVMYGAELTYGIQNIDKYNIPEEMSFGDLSRTLTQQRRLEMLEDEPEE